MGSLRLFLKYLTAITILTTATGCSDPFAIDVDRSIPEQRVNGNPVGGLLDTLIGQSIPMSIDVAQQQAAQDACLVQKVYLSSLTLTITDTGRSGANDDDNFDFVDSIEIYVASGLQGSSLPRVLVAELQSVPAGVTTLNLEVTEADIIEYAEEGARIETTATGSAPADDVTFDGDVTVTLDLL